MLLGVSGPSKTTKFSPAASKNIRSSNTFLNLSNYWISLYYLLFTTSSILWSVNVHGSVTLNSIKKHEISIDYKQEFKTESLTWYYQSLKLHLGVSCPLTTPKFSPAAGKNVPWSTVYFSNGLNRATANLVQLRNKTEITTQNSLQAQTCFPLKNVNYNFDDHKQFAVQNHVTKNSYFLCIIPTFLAPFLPDSYFFFGFLPSYYFVLNVAGHPGFIKFCISIKDHLHNNTIYIIIGQNVSVRPSVCDRFYRAL